MDNVLRKESKDRLPCLLTQDETLVLSKKLADSLKNINEIEDRLVTYKAQVKGELERIGAEVRHASHLISTGVEYREVAIEIILDYTRGAKDVIRKDTGEFVINNMPLTEQEKQMELKV